MDFEDWLYVMGQLKAMNCRMPSKRGGFQNKIVDEDEDQQTEDAQEEEDSQSALLTMFDVTVKDFKKPCFVSMQCASIECLRANCRFALCVMKDGV